MIPGLYIVSTPIGNLGDITLRALDVLKKSDTIFCENTKHSSKLLKYFDIKNAILEKYTDHDFDKKHIKIKDAIASGKIISLISDAGSPLISDPGGKLIQFLFDQELHVETIPGPSSVISAIQMSGFFNSLPTVFIGFLPKKEAQKAKAINNITNANLFFFSTAHQLNKDIKAIFLHDINAKIVVLNEITKKFEKRISLTSEQYRKQSPLILKGEFVICVELNSAKTEQNITNEQIEKDVKKYGERKVYEIYRTKYNIKRNDLYKRILKIKNH